MPEEERKSVEDKKEEVDYSKDIVEEEVPKPSIVSKS